jgi:argininosuccinate lyase
MMLSVTNAVHKVLYARFEKMMLNEGAFPEVAYSNSGGFRSYRMFEYNKRWTTFTKLVDHEIKHDMVDDLGIYSRKRNAKFLAYLEHICKEITPAQVEESPERFHTWVDRMLGDAVDEAMKAG